MRRARGGVGSDGWLHPSPVVRGHASREGVGEPRALRRQGDAPPPGRRRRMKFAMTFGQLNPKYFLDAAIAADRLGYESAWLPEHLVFPIEMSGQLVPGEEHPPVPPSTPIFDAAAYLAWIAAQTSQIRLGTFVYLLGLRHP